MSSEQNWERTAVTHGLYQPHCNSKVTGTDWIPAGAVLRANKQ